MSCKYTINNLLCYDKLKLNKITNFCIKVVIMSFDNVYNKVCRTCLIENSNMKSVFSVEEFMEHQAMLCDILMYCASVQVAKGDGLPEQVCYNCAQEMSRAFLFRKLCEKSDSTLRHYFSSLLPLKPESKYCGLQEQNDCLQQQEVKIVKDDSNVIVQSNLLRSVNTENDNFSDYLFQHSNDSDCNEDSEGLQETLKENVSNQLSDASKKKNYNCKLCDEVCLGLGAYRRHVASTHNQLFTCEICGKEFKSGSVLTRHKNSHEPVDTSDMKEELQQRLRPHKNKTGIVKKRNLPRTCTICNKTFRFHSNLERHKLIHTGEKPYLCNVCGKGFAQLSYLKIHSFIHTGEKPYKCQMCDKSFAAPGTLMTHVRTHTGERPHICKICGKDFPQSGYLSAHIRTHTGEKPVECKVCHRRFNQSGRLIIHMRIHSGEKPYACKECGRSFAVKGTLKKHIRTHTGERPYICSICGQAFAQSGTLATHMKVHKQK